jgi:hypothetical protein
VLKRISETDHQRAGAPIRRRAPLRRRDGEQPRGGAIQDDRVLAARHEKLQGRRHLVTTRVIEGLGIALYHSGWQLDDQAMMEEGGTPLEETVARCEAISGPSAPQVVIQFNRVALAESALGKHEEAVRSARRVTCRQGAVGSSAGPAPRGAGVPRTKPPF